MMLEIKATKAKEPITPANKIEPTQMESSSSNKGSGKFGKWVKVENFLRNKRIGTTRKLLYLRWFHFGMIIHPRQSVKRELLGKG